MKTFPAKTILASIVLAATGLILGSASVLAASPVAAADLSLALTGTTPTALVLSHLTEDVCQRDADAHGVRLSTVTYTVSGTMAQVHCTYDDALRVASMSIESTQDESFGSL